MCRDGEADGGAGAGAGLEGQLAVDQQGALAHAADAETAVGLVEGETRWDIATRREMPSELVRRADLIAVDSLEQAHIESGDLLLADCWANVVELQNVQEQYDPAKITIFKSLGLLMV